MIECQSWSSWQGLELYDRVLSMPGMDWRLVETTSLILMVLCWDTSLSKSSVTLHQVLSALKFRDFKRFYRINRNLSWYRGQNYNWKMSWSRYHKHIYLIWGTISIFSRMLQQDYHIHWWWLWGWGSSLSDCVSDRVVWILWTEFWLWLQPGTSEKSRHRLCFLGGQTWRNQQLFYRWKLWKLFGYKTDF